MEVQHWRFSGFSRYIQRRIVYFGSLDDNVYALNTLTGALKWSYIILDKVISFPAVADGTVYFGSYDHLVYAIGDSSQTPHFDQSPDLVLILIVVAVAVIAIIVAVIFRLRR